VHIGRHYSSGQILALTAPSPSASSRVALGGRVVRPDGSFQEPRGLPTVARHGDLIAVGVRPSSALLLTLR
jgi:hypothetical protein